MEGIRHGFDRTSVVNRDRTGDRPGPRVSLAIRVHNATGKIESLEIVAVTRPPGPVRQHNQLVRAVRDRCPDARLHRVSDAGAIFTCGNRVVTASYDPPLL